LALRGLRGILLLVRPPIAFISVFGAVCGSLLVTVNLGLPLETWVFALMAISAFCLAAGLMASNDVADLASDKAIKPWKPIPSGKVSPAQARYAGNILLLLSILISFYIGVGLGLLNLSVVIAGMLYNSGAKGRGVLGNIVVAYGVAVIPYYGAVAMGDYLSLLSLTAGIMVFETGREIVVTCQDVEGDGRAGLKTLPVLVGRRRAMWAALAFYLAYTPLASLPYLLGVVGWVYLVGASLFAGGLLLTWYRIMLNPTFDAYERYARVGTRLLVIFFQAVLFLEAFI